MIPSKLSEHNIIQNIHKKFPPQTSLPPNATTIGDDAAVLPKTPNSSDAWVISTDSLVEGTHFLLEKSPIATIAHKAAVANLSDLAAMGAKPEFFLLNLGIPSHFSTTDVDDFINSLHATLNPFNMTCIGGDTFRSDSGLSVTLTLWGSADLKHIKYRKSAQPGDKIYLTGPIGNSIAGLNLLLDNNTSFPNLVNHHLAPPIPLFLDPQDLGKINAMIDVSDGFHADLTHILQASNYSADIHLDSLPQTDDFKDYCHKYNKNPHEQAIASGEEYVKIITAPSNLSVPTDWTHVGEITKNTSATINYFIDNNAVSLKIPTFLHFS